MNEFDFSMLLLFGFGVGVYCMRIFVAEVLCEIGAALCKEDPNLIDLTWSWGKRIRYAIIPGACSFILGLIFIILVYLTRFWSFFLVGFSVSFIILGVLSIITGLTGDGPITIDGLAKRK